MRSWWLLIALLLSLGVNIGVLSSLALGGRSGARAKPPDRQSLARPPNLTPLADRLGLEGEERDHFLLTQRTFFETVQAIRPRLVKLRRQLHRQITANQPNRRRIDHILAELGETQLTLERALVSHTLESRKFLNRQQERQYFRFLANRLRAMQQPAPAPGFERRRPAPLDTSPPSAPPDRF